MTKLTFEQLIKHTLQNSDTPLTASEIWIKAKKDGLPEYFATSGKTPWATIEAKIYVDLKKQREGLKNSDFVKLSVRPARFGLKEKNYSLTSKTGEISNKNKETKSSYDERDLHTLLTKFVFSNEHFKCYTKTIFHEKSNRRKKGENKWLHPDIVGVHFPFEDYNKNTLAIINSLNESAVRLFSFEMKQEINFGNLREYFFQAVSNSSWSNEGYLVALNYATDSAFTDEMQMLNNSFGIGFIKLNAKYIEQSEILIPAKAREKIDWDTVNRLSEDNKDFSSLIKDIVDDLKVSNVRGNYDEILDDITYNQYILQKRIVNSEDE